MSLIFASKYFIFDEQRYSFLLFANDERPVLKKDLMTALPVFDLEQNEHVRALLVKLTSEMQGRKLEEGDWTDLYCKVLGISNSGWSNLHLDVMIPGLGIEQKMLRDTGSGSLLQLCGQTKMHPSATRSIRISDVNADAEAVMYEVFLQYSDLIEQRRELISQTQSAGGRVSLRLGWLIWRGSLDQFLYFEEDLVAPNPDEYSAVWNEGSSSNSPRKSSKSLWVYRKSDGVKRFSITTLAGIKIQPYFDVPVANDPNLYFWDLRPQVSEDGLVSVSVDRKTYEILKANIGSVEPRKIQSLVDALVKRKSDQDSNNRETDWKNSVIEIEIQSNDLERLQELFNSAHSSEVIYRLARDINENLLRNSTQSHEKSENRQTPRQW